LYLSKENLNSFLMINNNDTIFLKPPNNSTGLKTDVLKTRGHGRLFNYDSIKSHSELIKYIFESDFFYNKTYPICIVSDTVIVNFSYLDKNLYYYKTKDNITSRLFDVHGVDCNSAR